MNPHFGKWPSDDYPDDIFEPGVDRGARCSMSDLRIKDGSENRVNFNVNGYFLNNVLVPTRASVIEKLKDLADDTVLRHRCKDPFSCPLPTYVRKYKRYEDYFRYLLIKRLA